MSFLVYFVCMIARSFFLGVMSCVIPIYIYIYIYSYTCSVSVGVRQVVVCSLFI